MKDFLKKGQVFKFAKIAPGTYLCGKLVGKSIDRGSKEPYVDYAALTFQNSSVVHYSWTEYKEGGWERKRNEAFDIRADNKLLSHSWKVTDTSFTGGSGNTTMGHSAGYPDGHYVTALSLDSACTVSFFQSGSFIGMQLPENIELVEVDESLIIQELLNYGSDEYWETIESAILDRTSQEKTHLLTHQALHLLRWANIARSKAKAQSNK